jgi:hypothetical protein
MCLSLPHHPVETTSWETHRITDIFVDAQNIPFWNVIEDLLWSLISGMVTKVHVIPYSMTPLFEGKLIFNINNALKESC